MASILDELERNSREGVEILPAQEKTQAIALIETSNKSAWLTPTAGYSFLSSAGGFFTLGAFGLELAAVVVAGVGATLFATSSIARGVLATKGSIAKSDVRKNLRDELRRYGVSVTSAVFETITKFCLDNEPASTLRFSDRDKSTYMLRNAVDGSVTLVLLKRSSAYLLKDTVKNSVGQVFGVRLNSPEALPDTSAVDEIPAEILNLVKEIEQSIMKINVFSEQLTIEQAYVVEHTRAELLDVVRSYLHLKRLKNDKTAGYSDTLEILKRLKQDISKLEVDIADILERNLNVQKIYFDNRSGDEKL